MQFPSRSLRSWLGAPALAAAAAFFLLAWAGPAGALDVELVAAVGGKGEKGGFFRGPSHLALDREGNLHVTDADNGRIEVFSGEGVFVREYGRANVGVPLKEPYGICAGTDGNLYVADRDLGRILVFAPNGSQINVFSKPGSNPGELSSPRGIAVGTEGRIFVADTGNRRVSVFSNQGVFLYAIDASWDKKAELDEPVDVAVDPAGNVFILDEGKKRVLVLDRSGNFVRQMVGSAIGVNKPAALAVDRSGSVAILDGGNQNVRHMGPGGEQFQPFGTRGRQPGQFEDARGMVFDDARDRFYVADTGNDRIQIFKMRRREMDKPLGEPSPDLQIRYVTKIKVAARDVAVAEDGKLFVSLPEQHKVQMIDDAGTVRLDISPTEDAPGRLREPAGLLFANDLLYVTDLGKSDIKAFNSSGIFQFAFGQRGSDPIQFKEPLGLDSFKEDLYIADQGNERIQVLSARGVFRKVVQGDKANLLDEPADVAVARDGSVFVVDAGRSQMRKFLATGASGPIVGGEGYGRSLFKKPVGVVVDPDGFLYVLDHNGIQIFDYEGRFQTRFGAAGVGGGPGTFEDPVCLGADMRRGARLYVCDPKQGGVQVFEVQRVPAAPKDLRLESTPEQTVLTWTAPDEKFREKFVLEAAESAQGPWKEVASLPASPAAVQYPLPSPGTFLRVKARSFMGRESVPSAVGDDRFQRGFQAYNAGQYEAAVAAFGDQILASPGHPPSLLYRGRAYGKLGKFEDATNTLTDLSRVSGWSTKAYLALGEVFLAANKLQAAEDNIRRVVEQEDPKSVEGWKLYARVALQKGFYEDAISRVNKAIEMAPQDTEALLIRGDAYMAKKLYPDASKDYIAAQRIDSNSVAIYTRLAAAFLALGDKDNAFKALNAAIKRDPSNPDLLVQVAGVYYGAKDYAGARATLLSAQQLAPANRGVDVLLGKIAFDQGDFDSALSAFRRAGERDPNDLEVQLRLGLTLQSLKRDKEAKAVFQKVMALTPENAPAQLELARTFMQYKLYDLALDTCDKAAKLDSGNAEAARYAGEAYFATKRYPNAQSKLEEASRKMPNDPQVHYLLGKVYWELDTKDKAVARFKLAGFIAPRQPLYMGSLGIAYLNTKQYKKAADALALALQMDSANADYKKAYGEARIQSDAAARSGGGPVETTDVTFKNVQQSQFKDLEAGGICEVYLKNGARQPVHQVKVTLMVDGFMNFPAEELLTSIAPGQARSVLLKGKMNQAAYDLKQDLSVLAEIQVTYFFNKRPFKETIYEPFLIKADLGSGAAAGALTP